MNNYTPNELNDIEAMKQRVMHTSHIIKAELTPMGTLHVSLSFVDPAELLENEGYMKLKEKTD